jgi:CHAD domain-containing protein
MACDTAFRIVARGCLLDLTANQKAAHKGNAEAMHQMRVALTRLRTAISFFSPMVADAQLTQLRRELKWLHANLGAVRDLDVAIERLREADKRAPATPNIQTWERKRAECHQHLARALRSIRYRRLLRSITGWIDNGPWSIETGRQATHRRSRPIAAYSARKRARWQESC